MNDYVCCALSGFWEDNGKARDYLRGFGILLARNDGVSLRYCCCFVLKAINRYEAKHTCGRSKRRVVDTV